MIVVRTTVRGAAVLLFAALALTACGKKPQFVDPPQGKAADTFPQTYPNPAFDPKPGQSQSGQNQSSQPQPSQPQSGQSESRQAMPGEIIPGWKFP
ncbi:hypothetical protein [Azospirillum oleiclasticum]|uniref:hypothetical protein n=1 Tax=Azospirillum oleiclasticum TaxID=2735135 RepID=UPI0015D4818E|nr:hypothetical protein [Azospirillum oleiclasticum]